MEVITEKRSRDRAEYMREWRKRHREHIREYSREYSREYMREQRKRRKQLGLCTECNNKALEGHTKCLRHLLRHNSYLFQLSQKHKELGLCVKCKNKALPGYSQCAICNYKKRILDRSYYQRNRESCLVYCKKRRESFLREGRCYHCGAPLMEDESKYCFACRSFRNTPIIKGVIEYATAD